jgi:hypothetical protein
MSSRFLTVASVILAAVAMLLMASPVCADIDPGTGLPVKVSSAFTEKMEFDTGTAPVGWTFYTPNAGLYFADGKCQIGDGIETPPGGTGAGMGLLYYPANTSGFVYNYADGFTYDTSIKVVVGDTPGGAANVPDFSIGISTISTGSRPFSLLHIGSNEVKFGNPGAPGLLTLQTGVDNTDAYHTFRLAQKPNSQDYFVWRDDVLLGAVSGVGLDKSDTGAEVQIGGVCSAPYGESLVDFYRSTSGAWAPTVSPEPSSIVLLVSAMVGLLAYAWRKRR